MSTTMLFAADFGPTQPSLGRFGRWLLSLVLSFAIALSGTPAFAAEPTAADPSVAAEMDADADASDVLWFGAGCLLGVIGIALAYFIEPNPPAARLMGKASEYVMVYTPTYRRAGRWEQTKAAMWGCGTGTVAGVVLYVAVIAAMVGSAN